MIGPEGQSWRRRLSPSEVARAMGIDDQLVAHLGERGGYSLVGNAVPLEVAEALGQTLQLLVVESKVETRTRLWLESYPEDKTPVTRDADDSEVISDGLRYQMMQRIK